MSLHSFEVPPRSRNEILEVANVVRRELRITENYFPIIEVLELVMPEILPGYVFGVKSHAEMGENHGLTVPVDSAIYLREDVYEGVIEGRGRDRFTACHELGHYLLHLKAQIKFHRSAGRLKAYVDSEWQANTFAAGLMMPTDRLVECQSLDEICARFGVSAKAAAYQNRVLAKDGKMRILN